MSRALLTTKRFMITGFSEQTLSAHLMRRAVPGIVLGLALLAARPVFCQEPQPTLSERLNRAQEALHAKDFSRAAQEYRKASELTPTAQIYEKLGLTFFLSNAHSQAIEALRESVRLDANRWSSHLYLGISFYKTNQFHEALPHIQRAFELDPQQNDTRYWLGLTYQALGNYEQAVEDLRAALDKDPENIDILYALTQAYLDISAVLLKRLGPDNPDHERREALKTELNLKLSSSPSIESWDQSVRRMQELKQRYAGVRNSLRSDPEILYILSRIHASLAQQMAERVWDLNADSYRSHQLLGEAYEASENHKKALEEYREALRLAPDVPGLHYSLGHAYWQMKQFDEAIPEMEKELALNPLHASANYVLGHIYAYRRDLEKASRHLQLAVEAKPNFVEARKQLGKVLSLMQDHQGAIHQLELATTADPEDASVHYILVNVYKKMGLEDKVQEELQIFHRLKQRRQNPVKRPSP